MSDKENIGGISMLESKKSLFITIILTLFILKSLSNFTSNLHNPPSIRGGESKLAEDITTPFTYSIKQDGKEVDIAEHQINLKKEPFTISIPFNDKVEVLALFSFKDSLYNNLKTGLPYEEISINYGSYLC